MVDYRVVICPLFRKATALFASQLIRKSYKAVVYCQLIGLGRRMQSNCYCCEIVAKFNEIVHFVQCEKRFALHIQQTLIGSVKNDEIIGLPKMLQAYLLQVKLSP